MPVPTTRIRAANDRPPRPDRRHVLYWMTAHRRLRSNFALDRAVEHARALGRPLVIFEALRCDYPWASDRLHQFLIDGTAEHARRLAPFRRTVVHIPHVEATKGEGRRLFDVLAQGAAVIVTDDFPAFFMPGVIRRAAARVDVRLEAVDSNGILPIRSSDKAFPTAFSFRAHMQRTLRDHLADWPVEEHEWATLPPAADWQLPADAPSPTPLDELERTDVCSRLPIDHTVPAVALPGGTRAASLTLSRFVASRLTSYVDHRNHPDFDGTSGLSPYLHAGHLSAHDAFAAVVRADHWTSRKLSPSGGGRREGWWGADAHIEAFLDQLVTWRELGFHTCATDPDGYHSVTSLPAWATRTLADHAADPRPVMYDRETLRRADTHDEVWNAAQRQLVREGWMHNYLRMLWGKKILEWTASPADALDTMIALMDRYAIDGRDPNSYTGYLWCLGKFDRPWAPSRRIFGTVRYMSSDNTKRKLKIKRYLHTYSV